MILKLTTPYNPGDADAGKTYGYLHIDRISYDSTAYTVSVVYDLGSIDSNGVYTTGPASPRVTEITSQAELATFATAMSPAGEPALITTQKCAYQFISNSRNRPGTIDLTLPNDPTAPGAAVASNDVAPSTASTPSTPSTPTSTASSTGTGS